MSNAEPMELLVDTHTHTHYSDGIASVARIERFCNRQGIGISVTDHNEIRGSTSMSERERVPVIPGIEVGTEEGVDLLVYFASPERLKQHLGVEPGAVTVLGLVTDRAHAVEVYIDADVWAAPSIHAHPLRNDATLVLSHEALVKFLQAAGHQVLGQCLAGAATTTARSVACVRSPDGSITVS